MDMYQRQVHRRIDATAWHDLELNELVDALAEVHTRLKFAHPFREGNGRTSRIFLQHLAQHAGATLDDLPPHHTALLTHPTPPTSLTLGELQGKAQITLCRYRNSKNGVRSTRVTRSSLRNLSVILMIRPFTCAVTANNSSTKSRSTL